MTSPLRQSDMDPIDWAAATADNWKRKCAALEAEVERLQEALIAALSREAERGYDVDELLRRERERRDRA